MSSEIDRSVIHSLVQEWQDTLRNESRVHISGAKTKSALHSIELEHVEISTRRLSGIMNYDPQEFVVTVLAGTRILDIEQSLAERGQYLPFDPMLVSQGATIGGCVATNTAGSGRFRFGGIRDFLIGIRFIDGEGNNIHGGGRVVKNAAGFDFPKLMVGSRGRLGLIYELTFKVFPKPQAYATLIADFAECEQAVQRMTQWAGSPFDIEALDLMVVPGNPPRYELAIRIGGVESVLQDRMNRIRDGLPNTRCWMKDEDMEFWKDGRDLRWAQPNTCIYKLPITPKDILGLESKLVRSYIQRRYSVGGNVAWFAIDPSRPMGEVPVHPSLCVIRPLGADSDQVGDSAFARFDSEGPFARAIQRALDPHSRFL